MYTKLLQVQEMLPVTSSLTADGSGTTVLLRDDLQTFQELCYRLQWAITDDPRMGTSLNKEILVSVPLPPNT